MSSHNLEITKIYKEIKCSEGEPEKTIAIQIRTQDYILYKVNIYKI